MSRDPLDAATRALYNVSYPDYAPPFDEAQAWVRNRIRDHARATIAAYKAAERKATR